ncbi:phage tail sheath subtilisin-like domain-containing protein [Pseudoflavonifractor sp. MSJ-37]|uniref:phage tail sheath subtilisin-like domain-containing protein n=1 Tax=Pseudoflavonifractor sp. MSJ-37 TaxID=2841531 RepID=UPI00209E887F|nr:phage tail sheath subtilisin-like domain-containing protein [Pseudoflavonifractor sp. MSJ-37]
MSRGTEHERPGVYSSYDASTVVSAGRSGAAVGLAARCGTGKADELCRLSRYEEAVSTFGEQEGITKLVKLLFQNGAAEVCAVPVAEEGSYEAAFALLAAQEGLAVVVCDSTDQSVQQSLRQSVTEASEARRERICVVSGGAESVEALAKRAQALNSERVVLVGPAVSGGDGAELAAAVAGAVAGESDPAVPLGGAELKGVDSLTAAYGDNEIDTLVRAGVTPVEESGGVCSVVRGVTTRTKTGGASDTTWRELTTIRVVDDVVPAVRNALRAKFRRAKNTEQSRGAVRSQVVLELENKLQKEIISGYSGVTAQADQEDPTVCVVGFAFQVAHGLSQIWIQAHITV